MAFMTAIHKPVLLRAAVGHLVMKHKNVRMSIIFSLSYNFKTKDASQLTGCKEKKTDATLVNCFNLYWEVCYLIKILLQN